MVLLSSKASTCILRAPQVSFHEYRFNKSAQVPNPNNSYSDEIDRHLKSGQLKTAISTMELATRDGSFVLDLRSYSVLLKNSIRSGCFHLGELIHENFTRSGILPDAAFLNSLITLYSKSGQYERALEIFEGMESWRDLVSWSAMISGFATNNRESEAIATFAEMLGYGVVPNEYCYTAIIKACSNRNFFLVGEAVFGLVLKTGHLDSNACVGCGLIDMFIKGCEDIESAHKVFERIPEKNIVSWTLMITRLQQLGYCEDSVMLFLDMISSGFVPDEFTLSAILSACSELGTFFLGRQLHSLIVKFRLTTDVCVGSSLIDMYTSCSKGDSFHSSSKAFNGLPVQSVMSWTAIISAAVQNGYNLEAIKLFLRMIEGHVEPNHFTFSAAINACTSASDLCLGEQIYAHAVKHGHAYATCVGNSMISLHSQCGDMESARKFLDSHLERSLVDDSSSGVDGFTLASLLSGASSVGAGSKGEQIHGMIMKSRFKLNARVLNALISMYSRCGNIEAAYQVFTEMEEKNVISWTSMVAGFAKHGLAFKALETFEKMVEAGMKPNKVTYVAVLSACSHVGLVSEGKKHFELMKMKHGIEPKTEHYACMVDLLSRSGNLLEAKEFINSMPIEADDLVLRTFLGACLVFGNSELGEIAAKLLLEQNPDDPAAYVLLSNIYASTGEWGKVADIRKIMKDKQLKKVAGCSWLEVDNTVHKFYVGDTSHSRAMEIYNELEQLSLEISKLGYVPNTDFVLHDVNQEQKQKFLLHHSEKLAVAFGLLTSSGTKPVRIFKNLRVCGDCHTAMKYFSIARTREIVVRDSSRFHHFRHGKCSCDDHW